MKAAAALLTSVCLAGCSALVTAPPQPTTRIPAPTPTDRPTDLPPDAPSPLPPDAVPRAEPRSRYGNPASYEVFGRRYFVMADSRGFRERGTASWYGPGFHGERTSSGEPYDMYAMTAAHKTLPLPAYVRVDNLTNGRSVVVRVNDRGPFVGDRIIDLSYSAAARLDMLRNGTASVEITVLEAAAADAPLSPPADSAAPVTVALPVPTIAGQYIQAGAFSSRDNAQRLVENLQRAGISGVSIQSGASLTGQALHRVQVGPASSSAEADDLIERLALAGVPDARLAHPAAPQ
jgi:rare lipoprotein A